MTKTMQLERELLSAIKNEIMPVGSVIPSRNRLTARYHCSRTVVERAITRLTEAGYLRSIKGSGTYVASRNPSREIRRLLVVSIYDIRGDFDPQNNFIANEQLFELPVVWVPLSQLNLKLEMLTQPGNAVVWIIPGFDLLPIMRFLRAHDIPQLLINRDFEDFDCVFTDTTSSIREGLSWLLAEGGRKIALVILKPSMERPFLYDRAIAFYRQCVEFGVELSSDSCIFINSENILQEISEAGVRLFGGAEVCRAICVLTTQLTVPLVNCALGYGLKTGRDYHLLTIDHFDALKNYPGVAMMQQQWLMFQNECRRWLTSGAALSEKRFYSACKTRLLVNPGRRGEAVANQ